MVTFGVESVMNLHSKNFINRVHGIWWHLVLIFWICNNWNVVECGSAPFAPPWIRLCFKWKSLSPFPPLYTPMLSRITSENPYHTLGGEGLRLLWYTHRIFRTHNFRMTKLSRNKKYKLIVQGLNYEFLKTLSLRLYKLFVNISTVKNPTISEPVLKLYLLNLNLIFTLTV